MSLTYSDNDVQWAKMVSSLSMSIDLMFMEVSNKAQKLYDISHEIKDELRIQFSKEGSSCQETKKPIQNSLRRREEP